MDGPELGLEIPNFEADVGMIGFGVMAGIGCEGELKRGRAVAVHEMAAEGLEVWAGNGDVEMRQWLTVSEGDVAEERDNFVNARERALGKLLGLDGVMCQAEVLDGADTLDGGIVDVVIGAKLLHGGENVVAAVKTKLVGDVIETGRFHTVSIVELGGRRHREQFAQSGHRLAAVDFDHRQAPGGRGRGCAGAVINEQAVGGR